MQPDERDEPLFSYGDLATYYGTGTDWIQRAVARGEFDHVRAGREVRFTRAQRDEITRLRTVKAKRVPTRDEVAAKRASAIARRTA